jgi:hypothetical protein
MWQPFVQGLPAALVVILATFFRQTAVPHEHSTTNRVVGPGGVSVDCSCPFVDPNPCRAERGQLDGATTSIHLWRTGALIFLAISCGLSLFIWVTSPYTFAGYWVSNKGSSSKVPLLTAESGDKEEVPATAVVVVAGKGGPITPAARAVWRKGSAKP